MAQVQQPNLGFPDFWEEPLGAAKLARRASLPTAELTQLVETLRDREGVTALFVEEALKNLGYHRDHRFQKAARALIEQGKNLHAAYHNRGHVFAATVMAYRLSLANGLSTEDTALNILTMLGHDLGHPGRKNTKVLELEEKAAAITERVTKDFLVYDERSKINGRILGTDFTFAAEIRETYRQRILGEKITPRSSRLGDLGEQETIARQVIHESDLAESISFSAEVNHQRTLEVASEDNNPALLSEASRAGFVAAFPPLSHGAQHMGITDSWKKTVDKLKHVNRAIEPNLISISVENEKIVVSKSYLNAQNKHIEFDRQGFNTLVNALDYVADWKQRLSPEKAERWESGDGQIHFTDSKVGFQLLFETIGKLSSDDLVAAMAERREHETPAPVYFLPKDAGLASGKTATATSVATKPEMVEIRPRPGASFLKMDGTHFSPQWTRAFLRDANVPEQLIAHIPERDLTSLKSTLTKWGGWNGSVNPDIAEALKVRGISGLVEKAGFETKLHIIDSEAVYETPKNPPDWTREVEAEMALSQER